MSAEIVVESADNESILVDSEVLLAQDAKTNITAIAKITFFILYKYYSF